MAPAAIRPEPRQYRYVSYKAGSRGQAGWVGQVREQGQQVTVGGVHSSQVKAARAVAAHLGVPVQYLKLQPAQKTEGKQRKFRPLKKYVYQRGQTYTVSRGNVWGGSFSSRAAAEAAAADLGGESEVDSQGCSPGSLLCRLEGCLPVFKDYEPPDLQNLTQECQLSSGSLWDQEPALAFLSALGKYGPWRAALRIEADRSQVAGRSATTAVRVASLLDILRRAVQVMTRDKAAATTKTQKQNVKQLRPPAHSQNLKLLRRTH